VKATLVIPDPPCPNPSMTLGIANGQRQPEIPVAGRPIVEATVR